MTNYNKVFEERQYRSVTSKAARYYQERAKMDVIPVIQTDVPDALEYTYVYLADPRSSHASLDWEDQGIVADVLHEPTTYDLYSQQMHIKIHNNDIAKYGESLIGDKKDASIAKWVLDIDNSMVHGPKNFNGTQMFEGFIGQLTSIQDLDGTDSTLSARGDIWKGLNKMIDGIPFAMREEGPDMICFITESVFTHAASPDRVYQEMTEWDLIVRNLQTNAPHGRKIGQFIITNKILGEVGDAVADDDGGEDIGTADSATTDGRIFLLVPDPRWIARIVSRNFSLVGEEQKMLFVHQLYGWRGRGIIFNTDCAEFSEEIRWA